jgi:acyl-CoA dehydrogenase
MVEWACQFLFYKTDEAIQDIIHNFPRRWSRVVLRLLMQPLGYLRPKPRDVLNKELAKILTTPNEMRKKLSRFVFTDALENCPLGQLEIAFHEICAVEVLEKKLDKAAHQGKLQSLTRLLQIEEARMKCILSIDEAQKLTSAELSRQQVIAVDDFSAEELTGALKHLHVKKSVVAKTLEDEKL